MSYCAHCGAPVTGTAPICTACGKPHSGAPAVIVVKSGSTTAVIVAVVAMVVLVGVAMLGIIAAIAIPNLLNAIDRSKEKRTMVDLRSIGAAVEQYAIDNGEYPRATDAEELKALLVPKYAGNLATSDAWNWKIHYACWQEDPASKGCDHYRIVSGGKDGIMEHADTAEYAAGTTREFDCDIVFGNGQFVQYPAGIQT